MKIIVCSDSHGRDENLRAVLESNRDADAFLHLGDLCSDINQFPEVTFVQGNNDYFFDMPLERVVEFEGIRMYMSHSHRLGYYNRNEAIVKKCKENNCSIALYGHTHIKDDHTTKGIRILNPGSLYYNRDFSDIGYLELIIEKGKLIKVTPKTL